MEIIKMKTSDITKWEKNAKTHPQSQIDLIKESIQTYGFNDPVAVWGDDNICVEGHGRILAAEQLGINEVPTLRLDHLSDKERREYTIKHNSTQIAGGSTFDFEMLELEMMELDLSFDDLGLEFDDLGTADDSDNDSIGGLPDEVKVCPHCGKPIDL